MLTILAISATLASAAAAGGLVDNPIQADSYLSLDGKWTASTVMVEPFSTCTFEDNVDYDVHSTAGGSSKADTKEQCCSLCSQDAGCAAAVLADGLCWFKTEAQLAKKTPSEKTTVACTGKGGGAGSKLTIQGDVPGDIITDLQNAGEVGDPLYELNFLNASIWDSSTWTYTTTFTAPTTETALLVFDGVKMGAHVSINGKLIGNMTDQFLRYVFPLDSSVLGLAAGGVQTLSVAFDPAINCGGRWMSCTGGWDWAPYTNTNQGGIPTFSKGIWKSVSVVGIAKGSAAVTDVVPQITYSGEYPTSPLTDDTHGGFEVSVRVHTWAAEATKGTLAIKGSWEGGAVSQPVTIAKGNTSTTLKVSAKQVKLWWPVGHGGQPLYNLSVSFTPAAAADKQLVATPVSAHRRVGFRFFALVTGNDTDPAYVAASKGADGTDSLGMLWRINGAAIFSKGANMIPMEELEGRMAANAHRQLVQSAVDGGMNTLRVWGGGMFLPRAWYDACDELGIMVYHDMQYAQGGHSPQNNPIQDAELRHNIRRLAAHPSIVMWDGCNECRVIIGTNTGVYATFVMTVVAEEDASRAIWPSCPALGWTGGVDKLTSIPNGKPLTTPPKGKSIETHGPYQHGSGFPAVNGNSNFEPVSGGMHGSNPIQLGATGSGDSTFVGLGQSNIFASEFGSSVYSSFESMAPTIAQDHWSIHGGSAPDDCKGGFASKCRGNNVMAQRNYPCDNIITQYFGASDFDTVGELTFKKQLWQCMVGQALLLKSDIETRRSTNQFGIIVWQFNEIWPTGGWGSIEYGTVGFTKGQVLGGRWKPLHYWYKKSIYADVMATCGSSDDATKARCYVKNDSPLPFKGKVVVSSVTFKDGKVAPLKTLSLDMPAGAGYMQWFDVPKLPAAVGRDALLLVQVTESSGTMLSDNVVPFMYPKNLTLPAAKVSFAVAPTAGADGTYAITLTSDSFALYVTLTTLAQGRFEDNAFMMLPGTKALKFFPFEGFSLAELKASLRVEHTATYM